MNTFAEFCGLDVVGEVNRGAGINCCECAKRDSFKVGRRLEWWANGEVGRQIPATRAGGWGLSSCLAVCARASVRQENLQGFGLNNKGVSFWILRMRAGGGVSAVEFCEFGAGEFN